MDWIAQLALALGLLVALLVGGMWLPFAILISGLVAIVAVDGWSGLTAMGFVLWGGANSFTLTAVPLFLLMAEILLKSGVTGPLYSALARVVRPLPGGLLQTNIVASGIFAAICGSSVATAAAIGTVALPNLTEQGYDRRRAYGSLAAGGTLGILIPPSIPLILYGSFTEISVAKLFVAAMLPGLALVMVFVGFVALQALLSPRAASNAAAKAPLLRSLLQIAPFALLMGLVLGGIYFGWATPTEAAALGAVLSICIGAIFGRLTVAGFVSAVSNAIRSSCAILFIVVAALVFAYGFENADLGTHLTRWLLSLDLSRDAFLVAVLILFVVLGCLIESIAMIVITVPLLFPSVLAYDIDGLWFGVALVLLVELGQITPPFGINLFVIKRISNGSLVDIVRGTAPYYALILGFVVFIWLFPEVVTWLPAQIFVR